MTTMTRRLPVLLLTGTVLLAVACGQLDEVAESTPTDVESSDTAAPPASSTTTTQPPPLGLPAWADNPGPLWPGRMQAVLTFDDGPDPTFTRPILDILDEYQVPATFFVVGRSAVTWPELVTAMADEGHSVGNHTWNHPNLTMASDGDVADQIIRTNDVISEATGNAPNCFRAPEGAFDDRVETIVSGQGLDHVLWNINPDDYLNPPPDELVALTLWQVASKEGAGVIIGLHDGGGTRDATVAALPGIIEGVEAMGYEWVRLC